MTTYSHPETFCRIVCEALVARGERIKVTQFTKDFFGERIGSVTLSISSGLKVEAATPESALVGLCKKIAALPHWGIRGIAYKEPTQEEQIERQKYKRERAKVEVEIPNFEFKHKGKHGTFSWEGADADLFGSGFDTQFSEMFKNYVGGKFPGL